MRAIILLAILIGSLWAEGEFTEKRYIYALDKTTVFKGSITITDKGTVIRYTSPEKKTLIQSGKTLTVEDVDANTSQVIDLSKQIDMSLYFSFMRSIYNQDFSGLETYFDVTREGDTYHLLPKSEAKRAIKKMEITMRKGEMHKMTIYFTNQDVIDIETL
jgi:outer membrane lipoprotein-sorting protein